MNLNKQRAAGGLLSRRELLKLGLLGAAGLCVSGGGVLASPAPGPSVAPSPAPAKAVIQIWLWGGACHLDTFDPKPGAGEAYCGPFRTPIQTEVPGLTLCELLPLLARQARNFSLIRSLTHGVNAHETAAYLVQTGRAAGDRYVYPSAGAVVNLFKGYDAGYKGLIPPYVVLTELQGRFSEAGFLGQRYKPFATGGNPAQSPFAVEGVVVPGISEARQKARRELLAGLNTLGRALPHDPRLQESAEARNQAYDLVLGDAGKVFDLGQESETLRERYGKGGFGQSCLAARRLVERGVPYVTINYKGWDTHKQHFQAMRRMLPELDRGLSALLEDLAARGLLDSTLVWCSGEFGRTPRVQEEAPWNGGRGHYGKVFSALLAGGGFRGGRVVGATDERGEEVAARPVYPADVICAIYERLGISPDARLPHPEGLPVHALPRAEEGARLAGRLVELLA
jgi:uncharacterized protein (DUF1501 family)